MATAVRALCPFSLTAPAHHALETPLFDGPFFTVNKMRTLAQPQQIKANEWDLSAKDVIAFRATRRGKVGSGSAEFGVEWGGAKAATSAAHLTHQQHLWVQMTVWIAVSQFSEHYDTIVCLGIRMPFVLTYRPEEHINSIRFDSYISFCWTYELWE